MASVPTTAETVPQPIIARSRSAASLTRSSHRQAPIISTASVETTTAGARPGALTREVSNDARPVVPGSVSRAHGTSPEDRTRDAAPCCPGHGTPQSPLIAPPTTNTHEEQPPCLCSTLPHPPDPTYPVVRR